MTETWNTHGIVLQSQPWREWDKLYTIYTESAGKQIIRAQGIRRPQAKLVGALEPFAEVELFLIKAKHWPKLGGAVVRQRFYNLRTDLQSCNATLFCCEIVDRLTKDNLADPAIYQLLYSVFAWLDQESSSRIVVYGFVARLIRLLGFDVSVQAKTPPIAKVLRWLGTAAFADIQKLRLTDEQWQAVVLTIDLWLYEHLNDHVQSERFLV